MTVASFSLATADRQKDSQGNWEDKAEWHSLVAFQRTAEIVRDYVKKGTQLFIEGKIQTRSWDDKATGEKKYRTEILIDELTLLGGSSGRENGGPRNSRGNSRGNSEVFGRSRSATHEEYVYADQGITDDDIPF
jgi:single-strand DNA-binding protein